MDVDDILFFVYPFLDVLLLAVALPILALVSGGTFWKPFLCLFLGLVFLLTADLGSAWSTFNSVPMFVGNLWNTLYSWGYVATALGFYMRYRQYGRAS
jgi:hypothetical protein